MKLDSLGRMAGGIAHDFNNLLLAIMGNADLLDQDLRAGRDGLPLLDEIRKAAGRAADFCNQLSAFAGRGQFKLQPLDLSLISREMVPMLKVAVSSRVALRLALHDDLPLIEADVAQIHQIIMNLVVNASEALGAEGGTITVATGVGSLDPARLDDCVVGENVPEGDFIFLEVRDTGEGMDAATLLRIFDPFFTTKIQGRGLGLASVLGIARGHMAVLRVDSEPETGSRFRIHFPVAGAMTPLLDPAKERAAGRSVRGTILVVDDEEYVRVLGQRMLTRLGYQVILAPDGAGALKTYRSRGSEIDCVMLDLVMPEMDGVEVFEHLMQMDPDVKVVMTSGYHEQEIATRFAGKGIRGFLQKPYVIADLARALEQILGRVESANGVPVEWGRES
jgi:two-component system, cell cycle sensor histidine kinase and response regulator CckA